MWWKHLIIGCLLLSTFTKVTGRKEVLHMLGLYSLSGPWQGGNSTRVAAEMALEDINAREDILPDYTLNIIWEDDKCNAGVGVDRMYRQLYQAPTKVMIIGAACSPVSEATSMASHHWNIVQMSYLSGSAALSDKKKFPWFFRTVAPNLLRNPSKIHLIRTFNWKQVATIHQSAELFSTETEDLVKRLQKHNITLITSEIFTNDPSQQVQNLKRHDARIILAGCYEDKIYKIFCEAYKHGLYGQKYVWFISSFYSNDWWTKEPIGTHCTAKQITMVAEGAFGFGRLYVSRKEAKGFSGWTPSEWETIFWKRMEGLNEFAAGSSGPTYDAIWAAALALNYTEQQLRDQGSNKTLLYFKYTDGHITRAIYDNTFKVAFHGLKGWIQFDENGDCEDNARIRRIQNGERRILAYYDPYTRDMEFQPDTPIEWKGGSPPRDSTARTEKIIFVNTNIYIVMCLIAGVGISLSIFFIIFSLAFKNAPSIKMSSPHMNNVIVVGCVIAYITVFLQETNDEQVTLMCKVRLYSLMVGFSLAFGALFAKTWRVYSIFMNRTKKVVIKDEQLMLLVAAIVSVDAVIAVTHELVDPFSADLNVIGTIELDGGDRMITETNWICTSEYDTYFKGIIICIKGLLLIFGAFLALQTRKVKIAALNDSQYIGMCIYNITLLSLLGVVLAFALTDQVDLGYIFISSTIIVGTTSTQLIIFIPKIMKFKSAQNHVEEEEKGNSFGSTVMSTMDTQWLGQSSQKDKDQTNQLKKQLERAEKTINDLRAEIKSQIEMNNEAIGISHT